MEVQCLNCKGYGQEKDHCLIYQNYLIGGGLIPLKPKNTIRSSTGIVPWCTICQIIGKHSTDNYHLLHNFVQSPQQMFCNFYKFVAHDEQNCRSYELMMDKTLTYRVQAETRPQQDRGTIVARGGF